MRVLLGCVILVAVAVPGLAQQAFQVKDVDGLSTQSSAPRDLQLYNNMILFLARTDTLGRELWRTDGTSEGTSLVKDITEGLDDSEINHWTLFNGIRFFQYRPKSGEFSALWRTDGTPSGTYHVLDTNPSGNDAITSLVLFDGRLFFQASDGVHGNEPWVSDGSAANSMMFVDLRPELGAFFINPTVISNRLFFTANDGILGRELWLTDGTPAGTSIVKEINPSDVWHASDIKYMTPYKDRLLFSADDGEHFQELWISDGTTDGTVLLKDINVGDDPTFKGASEPRDLTLFQDQMFFAASNAEFGTELWKTDGTTDGTVLVKDIDPNPVSLLSGRSSPTALTVVGETLFFAALTSGSGGELWRTDGTDEGTTKVKEINPGPPTSNPRSMVGLNGWLYFIATEASTGNEVWRSDGTESGTIRLTDINPAGSSASGALVYLNGRMYFAGDDGHDEELWALNVWPWVESITPASSSPTADSSVDFTVTFSESVEDVDAPDFELLTENVVGASITAVSSGDGGITWTVTVDTGAGAGTIRLALVDDDSIVDTFEGLPLEGYGKLDGSFTGALGYTTDPNPAEALLAAEAVGEGEGETAIEDSPVLVTLTFNRGVTGIDAADFTLSNATIQHFTGEGDSYTFALEALGGGMVSVQLPADAGADYGGVPTGESNLLSFQFAGHDGFHSADSSRDNVISLSETLRVIQFFNADDVPGNVAGQFYCAQGTEDGYTPDPAVDDKQDCVPHDTDYNPQDWKINLSELLRVIQIFNQDVYSYCPGAATEDGYCPGLPPGGEGEGGAG